MADDTRQQEKLTKDDLNLHPENKPFSGAQWQTSQAQPYRPTESANVLAGGTENTAGGKVPEVTLSNAFEGGLKWSDFTELPKRPCVRDALMTGIGAGFVLGSFRAIFGATAWKASNWAVGSACFGSAVSYQWCLHRRQAEKDGMMRAVQILNQKEAERRAREQQKQKVREERRLLKEQEQDQRFAALRQVGNDASQKSWWKFW